MKELNLKKGFTIVEVSLVLAIAGLIFLMVFIALPAVQRTQRDAKRRDDVGLLLTAIQKYQNNNRGVSPDNKAQLEPYIEQVFKDPNGEDYMILFGDCGVKIGDGNCNFGKQANDSSISFDNNQNTMYIVKRATCDGPQAVPSNNQRRVAVLYKLEGGGTYCASTQ